MVELVAPTHAPKTVEELQGLIADAVEAGGALEVIGGGTKRGVGGAPGPGAVLSLAGMNKVIDYAPEELVLTAQAGVKLATLEKLVAAKGQMLPFEPPHLSRVLTGKGHPTLGGTLAANLSGPRRVRAGAARDHFLGLAAVTGRGEIIKAGGRVVKNVTGYDLCKLIAGSWGTLAVLTEVSIKVLPAPRSERTLLYFGLDDRRASELMTRALNAPAEISAAAHLPRETATRAPLKGEMAVTAVRLEGFEVSVASRAALLNSILKEFGRAEQLDPGHSRDFWIQIREVEAFEKDSRPLWRISVPPAIGWKVCESLTGEAIYDWGGGLVWLLSQEDPSSIRRVAEALGGYAMLYRGDCGAFEVQTSPLAMLTARVKAAFDPSGVLNRGRIVMV